MNSFYGRQIIIRGLVFIMTSFLTACVTHHPVESPLPKKVERIYPESKLRAEGSVWKGDSNRNMLFSDAKARNVGDIVTIIVEENTSSTQTATTQTSRQTGMDLQTGRLLGLPGNLGIQNFLGLGNGFNPNLDAQSNKSFDGSGTTTRNGTLTSTITAVIKEVNPNDTFLIEGRRSVTVNNEEQIMVLTGVVRYQDIGFQNTISSTLIADASITFSGEGVVADEQRVGWGSRLISWIWPF
ncbi:MAG: flagellar basal body L-ring protein FlgH [Nitrospinota bacterium]|nr:flagellar basal body L-ring protein FlgH [Nitrospinota bacterium]